MYVLLKYRAYVKPVVCTARIARLLVSKTPFSNLRDTVLELLTPINREGEDIEKRIWSLFEAKVTCLIDTFFQLLTPIYREGEEIERRTWSQFEAFVFMYVLFKYRAYVKPVVRTERIARLLV